jgi:hypothetical protein
VRQEPNPCRHAPVVPAIDPQATNDIGKILVHDGRESGHRRVAIATRFFAAPQVQALVLQQWSEEGDPVGGIAVGHSVDDGVEPLGRRGLIGPVAQQGEQLLLFVGCPKIGHQRRRHRPLCPIAIESLERS